MIKTIKMIKCEEYNEYKTWQLKQITSRELQIPAYLNLSTLSSDSASQLYIFWHYSYAFRVNSTEIGVFKQTDQVSLTGLLQEKFQEKNSNNLNIRGLQFLPAALQ